MKNMDDNQRKAMFAQLNVFSKGRIPSLGEIVYIPGDPSVGIFGAEGKVVGVHKSSADIQFDSNEGPVVEELGLEEFIDAVDLEKQHKFEEGLYADWLDEQPTKTLVEMAADIKMGGKEDKVLMAKLAERKLNG